MDNLQTLSKYASIILLPIQGLFIWAVWSLRKEFVRKVECEPRRFELLGLKGEIATLTAQISWQSEVMRRLEKHLDLLLQHHIEEDRCS